MINYYYSRGSQSSRKFPFGNPLANALVILVGTLAVAAMVVLGFIAFIAVGSLVMVLAAAIGIRVWWLNRKLSRQARHRDGHDGHQAGTDRVKIHVIEGEFTDLSGRDDGNLRP